MMNDSWEDALLEHYIMPMYRLAVREFWDNLLNATQMSCSGIYDWVDG